MITLQKPQIIKIEGSTIYIKHPDISRYTRSNLSDSTTAADTAFSVYDNDNFADTDDVLIGELGISRSEVAKINGAVTRGSDITMANTTKFDHNFDDPFTKVLETAIKIYTVETDGGVLPAATATIDIQWDKEWTEYTFEGTDLGYFAVEFSDGTTDSVTSDYVISSGLLVNSVAHFIKQATELTGVKIDPEGITREFLIQQADRCQDDIRQFVYESRANYSISKMWDFEKTSGEITIVENENVYALSGLTELPKYTDTRKAIIDLKIGQEGLMPSISIEQMDEKLEGYPNTTLNGDLTAADITATVTDSTELADSGSIYIVGQTEAITYTSKVDATGVLSGVPASGDGAITSTTALDGTSIWQNKQPDLPEYWTIYNGNLIFDQAFSSTYAGQKIKIKYYKELTRLTSEGSTTEVPFFNLFELYLCSRISTKKEKHAVAAKYMEEFEMKLERNAKSDLRDISISPLTYKFTLER